MNKPTTIKGPLPGQAVEFYRMTHGGRLPGENDMKQPPMPLLERLELAAQACHAAHLLSCEASIREAIELLKRCNGDKE